MRLHTRLLGGFLIGALMCSPNVLSAQDNPDQQPQAPPASNTQKQTFPPFPVIVTEPIRVEREKTIEPNWNEPKCSNAQTRDEADLCEQRRMADAADRAVTLNQIQLIAALFTIALLFLTVHYGRKATNANELAARATAGATDIARKSLQLS